MKEVGFFLILPRKDISSDYAAEVVAVFLKMYRSLHQSEIFRKNLSSEFEGKK